MRTDEYQGTVNSGFKKNLHGYNEDTIVIMSVNADTNFIYWEITEELLERNKEVKPTRSEKLRIMVFDEDSRIETYSFDVHDRIGMHYMKNCGKHKRLFAEIGFVQNGTFVGMLSSNPTTVVSFADESEDYEVWMQRVKNSFEIVRPRTNRTIANDRLQILQAKYCIERVGASRCSSFCSMSLPCPK